MATKPATLDSISSLPKLRIAIFPPFLQSRCEDASTLPAILDDKNDRCDTLEFSRERVFTAKVALFDVFTPRFPPVAAQFVAANRPLPAALAEVLRLQSTAVRRRARRRAPTANRRPTARQAAGFVRARAVSFVYRSRLCRLRVDASAFLPLVGGEGVSRVLAGLEHEGIRRRLS